MSWRTRSPTAFAWFPSGSTRKRSRYLLNSLRGEGFLNMRLTDVEAKEVMAVDIDPARYVPGECIASRSCRMSRDDHGTFRCPIHGTLFLPALVKGSAVEAGA